MAKKSKNKTRLVFGIALAVLIISVIGAAKFSSGGESNKDIPTFDAERGPLTISVDASGVIKALDQEVITCKVKGERGATVLTIVPEGTRVKKGDLLITLDSSDFEDALVAEEITLQNAKTTLLSAQESLAVGENQAKSDLEQAQLTLTFAEEDLEKYVEGDYLNQVTDANAQIAVKEEALVQAEQKLKGS
ncbi:MAG: HlyD family secretion protein, partial [Planctomycetota bacterium]